MKIIKQALRKIKGLYIKSTVDVPYNRMICKKQNKSGVLIQNRDTVIQMTIMGMSDSCLRLPTRIISMSVDPNIHKQQVYQTTVGQNGMIKIWS
jgi:hypothetical protein